MEIQNKKLLTTSNYENTLLIVLPTIIPFVTKTPKRYIITINELKILPLFPKVVSPIYENSKISLGSKYSSTIKELILGLEPYYSLLIC